MRLLTSTYKKYKGGLKNNSHDYRSNRICKVITLGFYFTFYVSTILESWLLKNVWET